MGDLYDELAEYTERNLELVKARCKTAAVELAWQWPEREDDLSYYRDTDLYLFDLTQYQMRQKATGVHDWLERTIKKRGWNTILDYGGGIGEWSIIAAECGCDVMYLDLTGSVTLAYAYHRFKSRNLDIDMVGEETTRLAPHYDAIICMDVLEHLREPDTLIQDFAARTRWLFANPNEIRFNWLVPQHISKYKLEPTWENVEAYLWKRREA